MFGLKDCKICGSREAQDDGVQLQSTNHIYGPTMKDTYEIGFSVFCCGCGVSVNDEYKDEVIAMWNKLHG